MRQYNDDDTTPPLTPDPWEPIQDITDDPADDGAQR